MARTIRRAALCIMITACLAGSPRLGYAGGLTPEARTAIRSLVFHPANPGILFAGTSDGVYEITKLDKQPQWRCIGLTGCAITSLAFDVSGQTPVLYAGTFCCGLYRFTPRKKQWAGEIVPEIDVTGITSIVVKPDDPSVMFVTTGRKLYRAQGQPRQFTQAGQTPDNFYIKFALFDPYGENYLRIAGFNNVYYKSDDLGDTWQEDPSMQTYLHSWNQGEKMTSVAANTLQEKTVCWRALTVLLSSDSIVSMVFNPSDPQQLFLGSISRGFTRLRRIENRWEATHPSLEAAPIYSIALQPGNPQTIYAGAKNELYRSKDAGVTWEPLLPKK